MSLNPRITGWQGRRVWLVGASSGMGRATASLLHARGAHVTVSARNATALNEFVAHHPGSTALPLDVTDPAQVRTAAAQVLAGGPPDLVCYCAGTYRAQRATAFDLPGMLQHLQVNHTGALYLLDAVLPALQDAARAGRGGHISLVSSVAGFRGLPQGLAYGPTKAALTHLAETLYLDLRPLGLGVSVVHPGFVDTPLTAANDFPMPA
ncbi:MAG: SDR family NAD(P)-dependent oxidoreductase, partial [Giesbergeria sp.]|nr:SDR family NAD(P)-dependent oxidoreductase [Giesbergeria sp.]